MINVERKAAREIFEAWLGARSSWGKSSDLPSEVEIYVMNGGGSENCGKLHAIGL